ncbi:HPr(Ser) kinase/phosphatase [soil metagenome]
MQISVQRMLTEKGATFQLSVLAGEQGLGNLITQSETHRPGLACAGFLDVFTYDRVQIMGNTETRYLELLSDTERRQRLEALFQFPIPCFVVTAGNDAPQELITLGNRHNVPILKTTHGTTHYNALMNFWLEREFAPTLTVHAVLVDVFGVGVLMMGGSGVGKSECGLELIERGHRLVADDAVVLKRLGSNILMGGSSRTMQHHMEVRGLGIIDVELLFGIGAVREEKRISLVVELEKWTDGLEIDRLGIDVQTVSFLDVPVRRFKLPVESGRNISILVEVAALQHRILKRGINPAEELNKRLIKEMMEGNQG